MSAADALWVSAIRRSGHACPGKLKRLLSHPASGVGCEISDQRIRTCLTGQNFGCEISGRRNRDRLRVQGVVPPDDTERASLSRATPSGFPKRTRAAMLSGTREHHTLDDSISYPDMLSGSLTKVSKPYYSPRSAALPMVCPDVLSGHLFPWIPKNSPQSRIALVIKKLSKHQNLTQFD